MKKSILCTLLVAIASCSTTTENLKSRPGVLTAEKTYQRSYQAVYRDLASAARACSEGVLNSLNSTHVDAELYDELGFAEVAYRLSSIGPANFYWKAEITKTGSKSSKVSVWSGNTVDNEKWLSQVVYWAEGGKSC